MLRESIIEPEKAVQLSYLKSKSDNFNGSTKPINKMKIERFTIFRPMYSEQQHMSLEAMWSPTGSTA